MRLVSRHECFAYELFFFLRKTLAEKTICFSSSVGVTLDFIGTPCRESQFLHTAACCGCRATHTAQPCSCSSPHQST